MAVTERVKLYVEDGCIALEVGGETIWEDFIELDGALFAVDGREWTVREVSTRLGHEVGSWSRQQALELGQALERLLFEEEPPSDVIRALIPAAGQGVRLELHLDDYSAPVPWEYLCLKGRRLAGQGVSFVRHVEHLRPRPLRLPDGLDRVELAYANPPRVEDGAFDADSHLKELCNAIDNIFGVRLVPRCTAADIRRALNRRPNGPPFIFHFLGHGLPTGLEVHRGDRSKRMECLDASVLAQWIATAPVAAVILGACESGAAGTHAMRGVAETIVTQTGVPVLAMQTVVSQGFSTGYLVEMYRLLANEGEDFEGAIDRARHIISKDDTHAMGIPVLYSDVVHEAQPFDPPEGEGWSPSPHALEDDLRELQRLAAAPAVGPGGRASVSLVPGQVVARGSVNQLAAQLVARGSVNQLPAQLVTRGSVNQLSGDGLLVAGAMGDAPGPAPLEAVPRQLVVPRTERAWPDRPYPLLGAYDDPRLLGGRARERAVLRRMLTRAPILGVFAVSGAGKSSLLKAGLLADLRQQGVAAAYSCKPHERRLAQRLVDELLDPAPVINSAADFEEAIAEVNLLAGTSPVLIVDQFEELFKDPTGAARAWLGPLLAATMRKGDNGPLCRWVISYRREFHGDVRDWLSDVLADADAHEVPRGDWPHNLATADRFADWSVPLVGSPPPGERGTKWAADAFYEAIMLPAQQSDAPWKLQVDPYDARRLAEEFANARAAHPRDPLVPELQVVLARLLEAGGGWQVKVPEEVGTLLTDALTHHARRAIREAVPLRRDGSSKRQRGLVWTALSRLVDSQGRRARPLPVHELAEIIGEDGTTILEALSASRSRLLVAEITEDGLRYGLSHDRLAQVIAQAVERRADVVSEPRLLELDAYIRRRVAMHASGDPGALELGKRHRIVRINPELRQTEARAAWWAECVRRRRRRNRSRIVAAAVAILFLAGVAGLLQLQAREAAASEVAAKEKARYDEIIAQLKTENAQSALDELVEKYQDPAVVDGTRQRMINALAQRDAVFWRDLLGKTVIKDPEKAKEVTASSIWLAAMGPHALVDSDGSVITSASSTFRGALRRNEHAADRLVAADVRLDLVESRLPNAKTPEDFGAILSAIELSAARMANPTRAEQITERVRAKMSEVFGEPRPSLLTDISDRMVLFAPSPLDIGDGEGKYTEEIRAVVVSDAFELSTHEVTVWQYSQMYPAYEWPKPEGHQPGVPLNLDAKDEFPVLGLSWYEARAFAEWVGARLPSEAEWEHAFRQSAADAESASDNGGLHRYCNGGITADELDEVGWYGDNSQRSPRRVGQKAPCGELYDMHGNALEWVNDWNKHGTDSGDLRTLPGGSPFGEGRLTRGGAYISSAFYARMARRDWWPPGNDLDHFGFRLARDWGGGP